MDKGDFFPPRCGVIGGKCSCGAHAPSANRSNRMFGWWQSPHLPKFNPGSSITLAGCAFRLPRHFLVFSFVLMSIACHQAERDFHRNRTGTSWIGGWPTSQSSSREWVAPGLDSETWDSTNPRPLEPAEPPIPAFTKPSMCALKRDRSLKVGFVVIFARVKAAGDERGFAASLIFRKTGGRGAAVGDEFPTSSHALVRSLTCAASPKARFARISRAVGNFVVFAFLIWSISWFYLPIDWPISWYSPRKIATYRANICGVRRTI